MTRSLDLSTRRQAREPFVVTDGNGNSFTLPAQLPVKAMIATLKVAGAAGDPSAAAAAVPALYEALFGADAEAAMNAIGFNEVQQIMQEAYETPVGESSGSVTS